MNDNIRPFRAVSDIDEKSLAILEKLSREDLIAILLINQETLKGHLKSCRKQERKLRDRISKLAAEVERDFDTATRTVVQLRDGSFATIETIVAFPKAHFAHQRCTLPRCTELEEHEHERRR